MQRQRSNLRTAYLRLMGGVVLLWAATCTAAPEAGPGRAFDGERLNRFRAQSEFRYDTPRFSSSDALNQLISQLWDKFLGSVFRAANTTAGTIVLYALAAGALLYFLSQIFGKKMGSLLYQPSAIAGVRNVVGADDLRAMNLEELLEESIRTHRFREAVRYLYLLTLRNLVEKKEVAWQNGKTNGEYSREVKEHLRTPFIEVTQIFEYLYYGDFAIDRPSYDRINRKFEEFHSLIGSAG